MVRLPDGSCSASVRSPPRNSAATAALAANRLRSHFHGPGTSSKSLIAKTRLRSADANRPKFIRCISPQAITSSWVRGEFARSPANVAALPRKKRERRSQHTRHPHRHEFLDAGSILRLEDRTGSGRPRASRNSAWDERGTSRRRALPFAIRSARDKRMASEIVELLVRCLARTLADRNPSSLGHVRGPESSAGQRRATTAAGSVYLNSASNTL